MDTTVRRATWKTNTELFLSEPTANKFPKSLFPFVVGGGEEGVQGGWGGIGTRFTVMEGFFLLGATRCAQRVLLATHHKCDILHSLAGHQTLGAYEAADLRRAGRCRQKSRMPSGLPRLSGTT